MNNYGQLVCLMLVLALNGCGGGGGGSGAPQSVFYNQDKIVFSASISGADAGRYSGELWTSNGTEQGTDFLKNINLSASSDPRGFTQFGGYVYFSARDDTHGRELFRIVNGDPILFADLDPGAASANPDNFIVLNNRLLFTTNRALWASDGTNPGTGVIYQSPSAINRAFQIDESNVLNGDLYFVVSNQMWRTDGSLSGTQQVSVSGVVNQLKVVGDSVYYSSGNSAQLWRHTGGVSTLLKDFGGAYGTGLHSLSPLYELNGHIFFAANDGVNGLELWFSDGTAAGTVMVRDMNPGTADSINRNQGLVLSSLGNAVYFFCNDGVHGNELCQSDGTFSGTRMIKDAVVGSVGNESLGSNTDVIARLGDRLMFMAATLVDGEWSGYELWVSDGTEQGTVLLKDIWPGAQPGFDIRTQSFVNVGGIMYFVANDGVHGPELWRTDGTAGGTRMVSDTIAGVHGITPKNMHAAGGLLYFAGHDDTHGYEPWRTDGTESGTVMMGDLRTVDEVGSSPQYFTPYGPYVLFSASSGDVRGIGLWRTDGTESGTRIVKEINPYFSAEVSQLTPAGRYVYFVANDEGQFYSRNLWRTDGTENGTIKLGNDTNGFTGSPGNLAAVANELFFTGFGSEGFGLWKTGGTVESTQLIYTFPSYSMDNGMFRAVGNQLYFMYKSVSSAWELWVSDGTQSGTHMVKEVAPADLSVIAVTAQDELWAALDGYLYFTAHDSVDGVALWRTNGTQTGTQKIVDIDTQAGPQANALMLQRLVSTGAYVFFIANDGVHGYELWKTNGTGPGTGMVKDAAVDVSGGATGDLTGHLDKVFFNVTQSDSATESEFWVSDGTANGTFKLQSFQLYNSLPFYQKQKTAHTLYFATRTTAGRDELWKTDGTAAGTQRISDVSTYGQAFNFSL